MSQFLKWAAEMDRAASAVELASDGSTECLAIIDGNRAIAEVLRHGAVIEAKLAALVAAVQNSERQFVGWVSLDVGDIDGNEVGVVTDHNKLLAEMRRVALAASRAEESL